MRLTPRPAAILITTRDYNSRGGGGEDHLEALFTRQFINAIGIETDDHLITDDQRGRGATAVSNQISDGACVHGDIADFIINTSLREV